MVQEFYAAGSGKLGMPRRELREAAAESGGAELLYTEDLNDGQVYGTVLVRNPFR